MPFCAIKIPDWVRRSTGKVAGTSHTKSLAGAPEIPGVAENSFGKGKVVYFAAGFDSAYYLYLYPAQKLATRSAIDRVAASPPPVEVKAPMCVHSTVTRQVKDGERLVVHLFNDSNTTAHHAMPVDDVPLREEMLPIHEIRVTFSAIYPIDRVHLEPEGIDLPVKVGSSRARSVVVPRLDVHAMVVVEIAGATLK